MMDAMDDSTRRMLRFSIFLQGFALAMFAAVIVIQLATGTTSGITIVFAIAVIALALGIVATRRLSRR
jgi:membrane associated rhomboid family serine protease